MTQRNDPAPAWLVWTALWIVYIVWGSTYLAIRVSVETLPPFLAAGVRFFIAGGALYLWLLVRRGRGSMKVTGRELGASALVGTALLLGGNGLVMLGERDVPSALAALIIAVIPLYVVVLRFIFGERVALATAFGVVAGVAGVAILIVPRGIDGTVGLGGMLMLLAASASWSIGTYYSKRVELPADPLSSTYAQMLAGGAGLLVTGAAFGELGLVQPERFDFDAVLSLGYLIVFGSVLAYTAYTWLLQHAPVSKVATYAFVNPVVAIVLGVALLGEDINVTMLIGAAMIVVSVALVIFTESRPTAPAGALEAKPAQGDAA